MHTFLSTALILALGSVTSGRAANLIKDGGFEQPPTQGNFIVYTTGQKIGPWTVVGASGNVGTVKTNFMQNGFTFPAKAGKAWLDLTGLSQTATGVAQTVKTTSGVSYTVTFWIGNVVDPGGIFGVTSTVQVFDGPNLLATATNSRGAGNSKQVWQKFTTTFVATAAATTLSFINGDPANDTNCGLDAVSITPTALTPRSR